MNVLCVFLFLQGMQLGKVYCIAYKKLEVHIIKPRVKWKLEFPCKLFHLPLIVEESYLSCYLMMVAFGYAGSVCDLVKTQELTDRSV